jgi:hypothetical protein
MDKGSFEAEAIGTALPCKLSREDQRVVEVVLADVQFVYLLRPMLPKHAAFLCRDQCAGLRHFDPLQQSKIRAGRPLKRQRSVRVVGLPKAICFCTTSGERVQRARHQMVRRNQVKA